MHTSVPKKFPHLKQIILPVDMTTIDVNQDQSLLSPIVQKFNKSTLNYQKNTWTYIKAVSATYNDPSYEVIFVKNEF